MEGLLGIVIGVAMIVGMQALGVAAIIAYFRQFAPKEEQR